MTRFPGIACDLADMDVSDRICPTCETKHGYSNEMYTDGVVDFCGYCYTTLDRKENRYPKPDPVFVQNIYTHERSRMIKCGETENQVSIDTYWDLIVALCKTDSESMWTAKRVPHKKIMDVIK